MKQRNLIILVVAAILLGALAYFRTERRAQKRVPAPGELFKDLDVNKVAGIILESTDGTVTVAKVEGTWSVSNRYNYPADFDKVRAALRDLRGLKRGQTVPTTEEQLGSLQLVSPRSADTNQAGDEVGTLVELYDAANNRLGSMLIGKQYEGKKQKPVGFFSGYPTGRYVQTGEGDVLLISETLSDLTREATDWMDPEFLNASSWDIKNIRLTGPDRKPIELARTGENDPLTLTDLDEEKFEMDTSKVSDISGAIAYLRFADIADPALTDKQTGLDNPILYQAKTKKGQMFSLQLGNVIAKDSQRYIRVGVDYDPPEIKLDDVPAENPDAETMSEEDRKEWDDAMDLKKHNNQKKIEEETKKQEDLATTTKALHGKLSAWTYMIEAYKANSMTVQYQDLVKAKEAKDQDHDRPENPPADQTEIGPPEPAPERAPE